MKPGVSNIISYAEKPTISVVVPHKNSLAKLSRLLESIPVASYIKVYVVDDNSSATEKAHLIGTTYQHVIFLDNPGPDFNAGAARNEALAKVESEWVIFADSDDFFTEGAFEIIVEQLNKTHPLVDIVFFGLTSKNELSGHLGNRHIATMEALNDYLDTGSEIGIRYRWPGPIAKLFRVSFLVNHEINFDSVLASNDVMFSQLSGHYARHIICIDKVVYCITESNSSLTAILSPERALSRLSVLVRRNLNLISWGIETNYEWGWTFFIKSQPYVLTKKKIKIYSTYFSYLYVRIMANFSNRL